MSEGRLVNSQRIRVKVGANGTRGRLLPVHNKEQMGHLALSSFISSAAGALERGTWRAAEGLDRA